jgi:hypothetical protein
VADSRVVHIQNAILGKVAQDFTSGYSALDMTGKVIIGTVDAPPYIPYGCVNFTDYSTEHGPTLGRYRSRARFEVYVFCGGGNPSERIKRAMNLVSDIINAITQNRFIGLSAGTIDDVLCNFTAVDGQKYGIENTGIGYIEITTPFVSEAGI